MKFYLAAVALLSFAVDINAMKKQTVKFGYKEGANQAYTQSFWIGANCLASSYIEVFASDGFFDATDSDKVTFKSVSGYGNFYTDCTDDGATFTIVDFDTDDLNKIVFNDKKTGKNATVSGTVEALFLKQSCIVLSETYIDVDGTETDYFFYDCNGDIEEGSDTLSIDTFLKIGPNAETFTSKSSSSLNRIGYVEKYESKSTCQDAIITRKVIKLGGKRINIPSFSTTGEICKVSSGYSERITFV